MSSKAKPALAPLVTKLFALRSARDQLRAKLSTAEKALDEAETQILDQFTADELAGVKTAAGQVTRVTAILPQAEDWEKIYAWIKKTGRFELLHKRLSAEVWREQLEAKRPVPGVGTFTKVSLKLTPAKG